MIFDTDPIYYVYFYIDPRNNLPFYVGKGKKGRAWYHLKETEENTNNPYKFRKIQKIRNAGLEPIIEIWSDKLTEEEAYDLEEEYISFFGRQKYDVGGILTNLSESSRPPVIFGPKHSDDTKKKIGEKNSIALTGKRLTKKQKKARKAKMKANGTNVAWNKGKGKPFDEWYLPSLEKGYSNEDGVWTPCFEWLGTKNQTGHGHYWDDGKNVIAHRYSYEQNIGEITEGMSVLHHCDNPGCVNPDHLYLGTRQDLMDDMKAKGKTKGLKGSSNKQAKFKEEDILVIWRSKGIKSAKELASEFNVRPKTIRGIWNREGWTHITKNLA